MPTPLRFASILAGLALLVAAPGARAADIHVDAATGDDARDGASWAAAVRSVGRALVVAQASPGPDTVHVAAGTYAENILVARGEVTLLGGYPSGGGTRDAAANPTIVDGGGAGPALSVSGGSGRIVLDAVTIDGFTFRNGAPPAGRTGIFGAGGGVFVEEAAVVLTNNVIESNVVRGNGLLGAGLYVYRALAGPSRIERNVLRDNRVENGLGGGAAIVDFADPALGPIGFVSNEVTSNRSVSLAGADPQLALAQGGGLFTWGGAPVVASNRFEANVADSQIDADYSGQGGAIFVLDAAPVLSNNVFASNTARASIAAFGGAGGGVYAWWGSSDTSGGAMTVTGNRFEGNRAEGVSGPAQAAGGGLAIAALAAASPVLTNNTFTANVATGSGPFAGAGGAVFAYVTDQAAATLRVDGGTVSGNAALDGGGGLWLQGGRPGAIVADHLLVEANEADYGSGILVFGDATVRNSRIRANLVHDPDGDQVSEVADNCRGLSNPVQADADADGRGDACDDDDDGDGVADASDNCPLVANPGQGAACAGDADGDGVGDATDNCPLVANPTQSDATLNGVGDACEPAAFDALETNAGGIWVTGDATLTNLEIVRNVGQGLLLVGTAADPANGTPEDAASVAMANLTIVENRAAGFITYLADGSSLRDAIVARNELSDGFDTERPTGGPSSPNVSCNDVYFYDGVASLPCTGNGNMDWVDGPPAFATGPFGDHYLAQVAAGQAADFVGVNAGSRSASSSPVAGLTTRTDAVADSGTVDLGYHYDMPAATFDDVLAVAVRATRRASAVSLSLTGAPASVTAVRWFRGRIGLLHSEYSHAAPFTGLPSVPECNAPPALPVDDPNAIGDGQAYYYLAVDMSSGVEGTFGRNSLLTPRTRPEDSPTDLVTTTCP